MEKDENQTIVSARGIHKEFLLPQHKHRSVKQAFVNVVKRNGKTVQKVLDGVGFEVHKGDFFGIVGRNGSGKSTLLKILAGVYTPTAGEVVINGGLTPFIELGVGFNPELSGHDNVFLNGALLGFSRKEMDAMYEEIVEFAELAPFMDQKLKNYSSGMQVRLAFSIAIKARSDVLIFDEVLAVGDEAFQRKCLDIFERYKAEGQTVILVTHDMETVKKFCNRAILVSEGKIIEQGDPRKVANLYSELNQAEISKELLVHNATIASNKLKITTLDVNGKACDSFAPGDTIVVRVQWNGLNKLESVGINIIKESGEHITGYNSRFGADTARRTIKKLELEVALNLTRGTYHLLVEAFRHEGVVEEAVIYGPRFSVVANSDRQQWSGIVDLPHSWR